MSNVSSIAASNGLNAHASLESSGEVYTVRPGDTLSAIAAAHGVSLAALEHANPQIGNPNLIFPGQDINIPAGGGSGYTVQSGDTLSAIAAAHGISLAALEQANPQIANPNLIFPGQDINIPADRGSAGGGARGMQPVSFSGGSQGPQPASGTIPATLQGRINQAMAYFESQGWTRAQAAGIVANLDVESAHTLDPHIQQFGGGPGYGLAQWGPTRQAAFAAWAGHSIQSATFNEELQFVQYELTHSYSNAGNALRADTNPGDAAATITQLYEIPADIPGQSQLRAGVAQQIYNGPAP